MPEYDRERIRRVFHEASRGTRIHGEVNAVLTRSGEERMIEWHHAQLEDSGGKISGLLCSGIDVTDRLRMEQEVINAAEEEQQRIARDLHDDLGSFPKHLDYHESLNLDGAIQCAVLVRRPVGTVRINGPLPIDDKFVFDVTGLDIDLTLEASRVTIFTQLVVGHIPVVEGSRDEYLGTWFGDHLERDTALSPRLRRPAPILGFRFTDATP